MKLTIYPNIKKSIFWDIDYSALDWEKYASFIIRRVFERGSLNEISELYKYYSKKRIDDELCDLNNFSERIQSFILFYHSLQ